MWVDRVTAARALIHMSKAVKDKEINKKDVPKTQGCQSDPSSITSDKKNAEEAMDVDGKLIRILTL